MPDDSQTSSPGSPPSPPSRARRRVGRRRSLRGLCVRAAGWGVVAAALWWIMHPVASRQPGGNEMPPVTSRAMTFSMRGGFSGTALVVGGVDQRALVARLVRNGGSRFQAPRVATLLLLAAQRDDVDPRLLVGIVGVENPTLTPHARNPRSGATGLMQVMPLHVGRRDPCGTDLTDLGVNVCYGTRILRHAMQSTHDLRRALLRYNGCVRTPGCGRYFHDVLQRAGLTPRLPIALGAMRGGPLRARP